MEIYCSSSPNAPPVKRASSRRSSRPSIFDSPNLLENENEIITKNINNSSNNGSTNSVKPHVISNPSTNGDRRRSTPSVKNNLELSSSNARRFSEFNSSIGYNYNTNNEDTLYGIDSSMSNPYEEKSTSFSEAILTAKLKKVAIEQENDANGTANSSPGSSSINSRQSSCSNFGMKHGDFSYPPSERFHMSEGSGSLSPYPESVDGADNESRSNSIHGSIISTDISGDRSEICSPRGTVRGVRNRVRAGIAAFHAVEEQETPGFTKKINYVDKERGKIVLYSTSISIIRHTYDRCQKVRQVLLTHMVRFEEKDLFMNKEMQAELKERLELDDIVLPWVFLNGKLLGDGQRLHEMNESGDLRMLLRPFPKICVRVVCHGCGGYRYVPCGFCHGSKKSLLRNHSLQEFVALKCTNCNENGLVPCERCFGMDD